MAPLVSVGGSHSAPAPPQHTGGCGIWVWCVRAVRGVVCGGWMGVVFEWVWGGGVNLRGTRGGRAAANASTLRVPFLDCILATAQLRAHRRGLFEEYTRCFEPLARRGLLQLFPTPPVRLPRRKAAMPLASAVTARHQSPPRGSSRLALPRHVTATVLCPARLRRRTFASSSRAWLRQTRCRPPAHPQQAWLAVAAARALCCAAAVRQQVFKLLWLERTALRALFRPR